METAGRFNYRLLDYDISLMIYFFLCLYFMVHTPHGTLMWMLLHILGNKIVLILHGIPESY